MKEIKCREYTLIKALGILVFSPVILMGMAGASYSYMNINIVGTALKAIRLILRFLVNRG
jgi:hypothetical protein